MAKLSAAERNRRKRERRKQTKATLSNNNTEISSVISNKEDEENVEVEIEYVSDVPSTVSTLVGDEHEGLSSLEAVMAKFNERAGIQKESVEVSDADSPSKDEDSDEEEKDEGTLSRRKWRELNRPTVGELKQRVKRPDLVEAHDVTAPDPDFLILLKGMPGTVPVPRHWGRKRKYLQGKRGIEKPPFKLPDFIAKTGIMDIRGAMQEDQSKMSLKQKQRARVAPKSGGEVDYRTLHDAFFRFQTKPPLTNFGELYYEGKEFEHDASKFKPGIMSDALRLALGMTDPHAPPPFLVNMQRYGPPPAFPNMKIPGLNAPLPPGANYGYHKNGWGKPPLDVYGRPLYGGDPFGSDEVGEAEQTETFITSDGKTIGRSHWGVLPTADDFEEEEESSEEEMEESSSSEEEEEEEEEEGEENKENDKVDATEVTVPSGFPPPTDISGTETPAILDLRKATGEETPMISDGPKQLYSVIEQTAANKESQKGAVFTSEVAYVLPGGGAESVLSKVAPKEDLNKRKRQMDDDDDADLEKKFKF